ncbi:MAG: hypothetical protein AB7K67_08055 [Hyphomicrobiaceae bacterium]
MERLYTIFSRSGIDRFWSDRFSAPAGTGSAAPGAWPLALPLLLTVLGWAAMAAPWLSGHVTIPWDAKAEFQPQIQFLADSLARGESPFWTPFVFSGHPQVADPQSMIFSLPFLVLSLLTRAPSLWAVDTTVFCAQLFGAAGVLLLFRDRGWHPAGAILAALAFAFGASMAWRVQHIGQVLSLAALPWALLCLERALDRRSVLYGLLAGLVSAHIVLGRDQVALLGIYCLAGYVVWRWATAPRTVEAIGNSMAPLAVGGIAGAAVIAIPLTLTALLAAQSNRPVIDYVGAGRGSLHPALLLTTLMPEVFGASGRMEDYWGPPSFAWSDTGLFIAQNMGQLYIGAIPILLILLGAVRGDLWRPEIRFFTVAAVMMLVYALGWYTPVFWVLYHLLPGVSLYRRPADATFLIGGLGAILAGYVAHRLLTEPWAAFTRQQLATVAGIIAAAFVVAFGLGIAIDRLPRLPGPLAVAAASLAAGALVLAWARPRILLEPRLAAIGLAAFTAADLGYNNGPSSSSALPPSVYEVLQPGSNNETIALLKSLTAASATDARRDRIELAGLGFHWPNASQTHRLENTLGYNPVRLALYSRATGAEDHVGLPDQRKFSPLFPSYRSILADLLGLHYIVTGVPIEKIDPKVKPNDFKLIAHTHDGYIYENPWPFDRVLFATEAIGADFDRILADGVWPDVNLNRTVLLQPPPTSEAQRRPGTARLISYRNTDVVVEADSPDGGFVVLNDVWQPWWTAELNGRRVPLLRANVLFRAVAVPPGKVRVRFKFRPLLGAWEQITGKLGVPF